LCRKAEEPLACRRAIHGNISFAVPIVVTADQSRIRLRQIEPCDAVPGRGHRQTSIETIGVTAPSAEDAASERCRGESEYLPGRELSTACGAAVYGRRTTRHRAAAAAGLSDCQCGRIHSERHRVTCSA